MNHKFKLKQRVAALCMAAMMCCSLFPAGAFAEAPRADADGTFIMEQDNENVTPDAPQTDESNPDSGENTPEDSETPMVTQSADEDKPVYRFHRLYLRRRCFVHRLTGCTDWFLYGQSGTARCHG